MTKQRCSPLHPRGNGLVPYLLLARSHSWSSVESCGIPPFDGCALTRDREPCSSEHTSYITGLAFFFQMYAPVADLQHWVMGSGRNPVACVFSKTVQSSERMAGRRGRNVASCQGLRLGADPRTPRLTLSAPLPTDPLNPGLRGAATSEHRVTQRPVGLAGSVWSSSKGRAGQRSREEPKVVFWADVGMEERGMASASGWGYGT